MNPHVIIENPSPSVDGGRYPAKRTAGEPCVVEADIFRDGHAEIAAALLWRHADEEGFHEVAMRRLDNDRWRAEFPLAASGRYQFTVEAWTDRFTSWKNDLAKRVQACMPIASELLEGAVLLESVLERASPEQGTMLAELLRLLRSEQDPGKLSERIGTSEVASLMAALDPRRDRVRYEPVLTLIADRIQARFSAWYEMFPRSQGKEPARHAGFVDAALRLPEIREMGFDVVYLPPIHPIGTTHRKGRNNHLVAGPDDPGSPWAIGSRAGGHDAIHPDLGTFEDFDHFVATARRLGLEVALDFAIQCSPDHPWLEQHPDWFHHRPDGSIKHAENPPKKYEDIVPLNFDCEDRKALEQELRRVLLFWIARGIKAFRVDNPHTKPVPFWAWLIAEVQREHPDVIFLSEAFTRPKMMKTLAKIGFSQSYTYFTWKNRKAELVEYLSELNRPEVADYLRPNFFANTPDILHEVLQRGGRPAFQMRLILAATLSPAYGIYSGFELCENLAVEGSEEYLDSEKYEIRVRDWNQPGNIRDLVVKINAIRRENPALQHLDRLRFLDVDNEHILVYAKTMPDFSNTILVAVNLDPFHVQETTLHLPVAELLGADLSDFDVVDLVRGERHTWGRSSFLRLDPQALPALVLRVERRP